MVKLIFKPRTVRSEPTFLSRLTSDDVDRMDTEGQPCVDMRRRQAMGAMTLSTFSSQTSSLRIVRR